MPFFRQVLILILAAAPFMGHGQAYREVRMAQLDSLLQIQDDTLYVVNFWATWCKPCVAELPEFERAYHTYENAAVKIILVSLDFQKDIDSKFRPFLADKRLSPEIWFMAEKKFDRYVSSVDKDWSGALPFTIIRRSLDGVSMVREGIFEPEELIGILNRYLTP